MVRSTVNKFVFCQQSSTVWQKFFAPINGFVTGNGGNSGVEQKVLSGIRKEIEQITALESNGFRTGFALFGIQSFSWRIPIQTANDWHACG